MAYKVTSIVYACRPCTILAGGIPHQDILLIFGKELSNGVPTGSEVLLWRGYEIPGITPGEWSAGTWGITFAEGQIEGEGSHYSAYSPIDTATASISASVVKDGKLEFSYQAPGDTKSRRYFAYLTNYTGSEARYSTPYSIGGVVQQPSQIYDYVPGEVGLSNDGSTEAYVNYGTYTGARRTVFTEGVEITSFDVQLTGPKQFTATFSGNAYLETAVGNRVALALYATEMNGETIAEIGTYTLTPTWGAESSGIFPFSGSLVLTDIANQIGYDLATKYRFYAVAFLDSEESATTETLERWTQRKLSTPAKPSASAADGVGSVTWSGVENAASYLLGLVNTASAEPSSSSSASSPWNFNETTSGTTVQGKYARVKAVPVANQYEWGASEWSEAVLIPDNRTPQGEDPITPVEINMTRRIYKAIPFIDVPVEQIGAGGSVQDVITVEYANAHYVAAGDAITPSTLPIATADALGAIKVGTHLSINAETGVLSVSSGGSIASGDTGLVTGGTVYTEINKYSAFKNKTLETSVQQNNANAVTGGAVYTFVTTVSNLPKAKAAGGTDNAGIVYVTAAVDKQGLIIDSQNNGLIQVDFAGTSNVTWNSTVTNKVANPKYVKMAIEGYVADSTNVTATGGTGQGGKLVKLDSNGKIDSTMLDVVSVSNYHEASSQAAMTALTNAQDGDICIRTDEHKTYILMSDGEENGYATASNWKELTAPTGTVTSVNGNAGPTVTLSLTDIYASGTTKVTIDQSISSTAIGTENYHFPTSKAVQGYVSGQISALNLGGAATYSVATWTAGTTAWDTGGTGLATANYLKLALTDFKSDLTYSDVGAAAASHTHPIGEITYTISSTNYTASIASSISSSSKHEQIPTAKAVYDYKPFVNRIIAGTSGTTTFSGVTTNLATSISSENYSIPTAYAVQQALNGKAASSHNQAITTIYATGTTAFTGTVTAFSSYTASSEDYKVATAYAIKQALSGKANSSHSQAITTIYATGTTAFTGTVTAFGSYTASSEDYKVATAYAIKQALAGKANSSHTHTSEQISDAISTVDDPEASASHGKVVKTESDWGQIHASLIPIDDNSIILLSGSYFQVSTSWLYNTLDGRYLKPATAASTYLARSNANASDWTSGTSYSVGQLVFVGTTVWRCIQGNTATSLNGPGGAGNVGSGNNYVYWVPVTVEFSNRYDGTITGDGSTTLFTVTHNLGVKDVDVTLIDASTDQEVYSAVTMYSATQVKIGFGAAPASGKVYRVIVRR